MSDWIDIEHQRPPLNERVIVLVPFGMQVRDDTWTEDGWMNDYGVVSHWQPINPPGTYTEIAQRDQGPLGPVPKQERKVNETIFSDAVNEHFRMMESIAMAQVKLRFEQRRSPTNKNEV